MYTAQVLIWQPVLLLPKLILTGLCAFIVVTLFIHACRRRHT